MDLVPFEGAPSQASAETASTYSYEIGAGTRTSRVAAGRIQKASWTSAATGTQYINGKALIPSKWRGIKFMVSVAYGFV